MDLSRIPKDGKNYHIVWFYNNQWWGNSFKWDDEKESYLVYSDDPEADFYSEDLPNNDCQYYIVGIETWDIVNQHEH